jgi:hypothetical protein
MSNRDKRIAIFRACAPAAASFLGTNKKVYLCPICGKEYSEKAAFSGQLSLEDVPPRCMGGKGLLLTCKRCNSSAGHKIDSQIKSHLDLKNFADLFTGKADQGITSCVLRLGGQELPVTVKRNSGKTEIRVIDKANDPKKVNDLKGYMVALSAEGKWDGEKFDITKNFRLNDRLLKIALLKSGFLLVTAWLGYRYAFDERLYPIRQQIANPEKDLLATRFWMTPTKGKEFPAKRILSVTDPFPFFMVSFENGATILPNPFSPLSLYEILSTEWNKNQRVRLKAEIYKWPERAIMFLDHQI